MTAEIILTALLRGLYLTGLTIAALSALSVIAYFVLVAWIQAGERGEEEGEQ